MVVIICVAGFGLLMVALALTMLPITDMNEVNMSDIIKYDVGQFSSAITQRYEENPGGGYLQPAGLVVVPGYEHLRSNNPDRLQGAVTTNVNDSIWRFNRVAIWFQSPVGSVTEAAYITAANNSCGVGTFSTGVSWCGRDSSIWFKAESRSGNSNRILAEKQRIYRTMDMFLRRYSSDQTFTALAPGTVRTLPQLVGFAGTAATCSGIYNYYQMPFTCDNLFNDWGIPITLNQITANRIALVNRTGVINNNGQPVRLSEEANLE